MKRKAPYRMGVGVSSLLLILVVISMTTLSVLALLSATSDLKLSEKRASYVLALFEANSRVEEAFFKLNEGIGPDALEIEGLDMIPISDQLWTISAPFFEDMRVEAQVALSPKGIERRSYDIINTGKWEPEDSWHLLD